MNFLNKKLTFLFWIILILSLLGCNSASDTLKTEIAHIENAKSSKQEIENINQDTVITEENKDEKSPIVESNENNETSKLNNTTPKQTANKESEKVTQNVKSETASSQTKTENTSNKPKMTETKKQSTSNKSTTKTEDKSTVIASEPEQTVTITIIGSDDIGIIVDQQKISLEAEDTVLDILLKAAENNHFDVEYSGSGAMAYIEGIDNLYEFDYGPKSGWNYKLNGTVMNKSSDAVKVKKDDVIEWVYSEDFTEGSS